ncbi:GGDEF domain-containing protein [Mariprofundus erugo]|uniref:GGDEF domain-containing protein n=2 Tax=Mariprofundus erugo TaxID=2528639 RepID=A0A5R9GQB9_9PROT|nr:GGDEF domain-containing protein [Mariprofundus erugo]
MTMDNLPLLSLIGLGALVLIFSSMKTMHILAMIKDGSIARYWRILKFAMIFFLVGYLGVMAMVVVGITDILILLTGMIFFFGALFVYFVVHTGELTIQELLEDEKHIRQLAHFDAVTSLPNRTLFFERLSKSITLASRHQQKLAVLFIDLDGFKEVNDSFGHDTGDAVLKAVAERLTTHVRGADTVGRVGGDEFLVLLNEISSPAAGEIVARKMIDTLNQPIIDGEISCQVGASIGIAIFPDDGNDIETLIKQADDAMYVAKRGGKNQFISYAQAFADGPGQHQPLPEGAIAPH